MVVDHQQQQQQQPPQVQQQLPQQLQPMLAVQPPNSAPERLPAVSASSIRARRQPASSQVASDTPTVDGQPRFFSRWARLSPGTNRPPSHGLLDRKFAVMNAEKVICPRTNVRRSRLALLFSDTNQSVRCRNKLCGSSYWTKCAGHRRSVGCMTVGTAVKCKMGILSASLVSFEAVTMRFSSLTS